MAARVSGNAAALLAARLVSVGVGLVATPFLFGMLGARQFGVWALLLGIVAIVGYADLGLGSAQVREVAQATAGGDRRRSQAALAVGLAFYGALSVVVFACFLGGWSAFGALFDLGDAAAQARNAALLLAGAFAVDALSTPWRAALEGSQRMRPIALAAAVAAVVNGGLGVGLVAAGAGLVGVGWAAVGASLVRAALVVGAAGRAAPALQPSVRAVRRDDVGRVLRYGARVQATNAASAVNSGADRLVLGGFFSPAVVAPFELGARLAGLLRIAPWHFLTAFFPVAAALHARGERALLDRLYLRATRYLAAFACVSAAALIVSAEPLVELWIGRRLPLAVTTVVLLAVAFAVNLTSGAAATVTRAEGEPGRETRYALVAAGLNVALAVPFLLVFGPVGVPLATAVAYVLATAYFFWHFHRASGRALTSLVAAVWKPYAAAGTTVALAFTAAGFFPDPSGRFGAAVAVASRAAFVVALATGTLVVLRFFEAEDRALLGRLVARVRVLLPPPVPVAPRGERAW